jgi:hypothetical protein
MAAAAAKEPAGPAVSATTNPATSAWEPTPAVSGSNKQLFEFLSEKYAAVFNPSEVLPPVSHNVEHHLVTSGPQVSAKFCRLDGVKLAAARTKFEKMEREGVVRRSTSPWASPLHMVEKTDGSWRPCGDFRPLNLVALPDFYPLPNMMIFRHK